MVSLKANIEYHKGSFGRAVPLSARSALHAKKNVIGEPSFLHFWLIGPLSSQDEADVALELVRPVFADS